MTETEISASRAINLEPPPLRDVQVALKDVVDPDLGANVVDLGLLYGLEYGDNNALVITMTLTSAACPLAGMIEEQVGKALSGIVGRWQLNWVWMPPWGPDRITDAGRNQMRALGPPPSATTCSEVGRS
ncbi:metal-sulfur cluster assembly factor [Arthrobacter cavernae]|uniref:Metal-sulfur cluster assembly factor n=1 Tax=Arthrobacter cavernae TaxID=2817681 RepID=A0A939KP73_9MICC|nr:metal-sulfur cluster assembly factor [Arthrobacter cavernae]MBO1268365.1 metal-sulfur cluster assembly factor [Arthrobacter cavernae]